MGDLSITRNDSAGQIRSCDVLVDGQRVASLRHGETWTGHLPNGRVTVEANTNRYRSQPCAVEISDTAPARLEIVLLDPLTAAVDHDKYYLVRPVGAEPSPATQASMARAARQRGFFIALVVALIVFLVCLSTLPLNPWGWIAAAVFAVVALPLLVLMLREVVASRRGK